MYGNGVGHAGGVEPLADGGVATLADHNRI